MAVRLLLIGLMMLSGCVARAPPLRTAAAPRPIEVQILALNDFHGNLQPSEIAPGKRQGGAAALGAALAKARLPDSITVAAGDLIGATPLESALFLDEPSIDAMNLVGLELAAVGNHEFDKGSAELLRMQQGGCARLTTIASRIPCRLEPFGGARFRYLAANVRTADGATLFPATALRQLGPVRIGFIGMTLKDTATLVTPAGVAGLRFEDEAATANALVPELKAAGADAIVLLIHQGGKLPETYRLAGCDGLSGGILPILDRLDPAIRVVVSGHTHNAYACEVERGGGRRLLSSAGKNGYFYTDIRLRFDPSTHALLSGAAANVPVAADGAGKADVAALVARTVAAASPAASRVVGRLPGPVDRSEQDLESPLADLIADAQLAATRAAGAQIAFTNATGVRTSLVPRPDGSVTYGQLFALQPFGNGLVVKTLTGTQLRALLEQQFTDDRSVAKLKSLLAPSAGFAFRYDLRRPAGQRIVAMTLHGRPIVPAGRYRVTANNFLSSGGDGFVVLGQGTDTVDAGLDLDALEAWVRTSPPVPAIGRARDITPAR